VNTVPQTPVERLDRISWPEAAARFRKDPRLLLPVGSCVQHGPHLPLGTDTIIAERLAEDVARRTGLLMAPTVAYGVSARRDREYAGTASLDRKTLHRVLNEIIESWEGHGLEEVVLITANGFARNIQALAMVMTDTVRVRSVDLCAVDLDRFLEDGEGRDHGGELETSLLLHLAPDLVRQDAMVDGPRDRPRGTERGEPVPAPGSPGVVGRPSLASAEKGREIYEHLLATIAGRLAR
jgi:creatinine amidohydrolase/Fe(II)-dependent formamide hydrolase-like protein